MSVVGMPSILRCPPRRLAPAARFVSKAGGCGSSGPSFTTVRRKFSTGGGVLDSTILWDVPFNLRTPETWFAIIGVAIGATNRFKALQKDHENGNQKEGAQQS